MSHLPTSREIYKHFKGNLYQILEIATHSETGEQLVIYQALYGDFKVYARPLDNFMSKVDMDKYPDCTQVYRFELQGAQSIENDRNEMETSDYKTANNTIENTVNEMVSNTINKVVNETVNSTVNNATDSTEEDSELEHIDPMVMQFLDATTYEDRLNILMGLKHRITDDMITTMAIVCDIEIPEGDVEERFEGLKNCLITLEKFECNRLR